MENSNPEFKVIEKEIVELDGKDLIRAWRKFIMDWKANHNQHPSVDPSCTKWYNGLNKTLITKLLNALRSDVDLALYGKETPNGDKTI